MKKRFTYMKEELGMKRKILWLLTCAWLMLLCAGVNTVMAEETAVIDGKDANRVHLRNGPSRGADSLGLYFTGTQVICGESQGEWTRVTVGAQTGYIKSEYLVRAAAADSVAAWWPHAGVLPEKADGWVNLRAAPSLNADITRRVRAQDELRVLGETAGGWYYVKAGEEYGYVYANYMSISTTVTTFPASVRRAYRAVFKSEAPVVYTPEGKSIMLDALVKENTDQYGAEVSFTQFAAADLDGDGAQEVVLWENVGLNEYYGFMVLREQDGVVYGYEMVYRAMYDLKADGTSSFSSGVTDNGFGRYRFTDNGCESVPQAYSRMNADESVSYFVQGQSVSKDAFDQQVTGHDAQAGAAWHAMTKENIEVFFGE